MGDGKGMRRGRWDVRDLELLPCNEPTVAKLEIMKSHAEFYTFCWIGVKLKEWLAFSLPEKSSMCGFMVCSRKWVLGIREVPLLLLRQH